MTGLRTLSRQGRTVSVIPVRRSVLAALPSGVIGEGFALDDASPAVPGMSHRPQRRPVGVSADPEMRWEDTPMTGLYFTMRSAKKPDTRPRKEQRCLRRSSRQPHRPDAGGHRSRIAPTTLQQHTHVQHSCQCLPVDTCDGDGSRSRHQGRGSTVRSCQTSDDPCRSGAVRVSGSLAIDVVHAGGRRCGLRHRMPRGLLVARPPSEQNLPSPTFRTASLHRRVASKSGGSRAWWARKTSPPSLASSECGRARPGRIRP